MRAKCFSHTFLLSSPPTATQALHQAISILYGANRNFAPRNLGPKKLSPFKHYKRSKKLNFRSRVWWCIVVIPARKSYLETGRQEFKARLGYMGSFQTNKLNSDACL